MLIGIDGVKLIDLYKMQTGHFRFPDLAKAIFHPNTFPLLVVPVLVKMLNPFNEVFRGLACGKAYHSIGVGRYPFKEPECSEEPEFRKILNDNVWCIGPASRLFQLMMEILFNFRKIVFVYQFLLLITGIYSLPGGMIKIGIKALTAA